MGDVSKKLMEQFAANLNTMLDDHPRTPNAAETADAPTGHTTAAPTTDTYHCWVGERRRAAPRRRAERVHQRPGHRAESTFAAMAGPALLKRIGPVVLGLLIVFLLLRADAADQMDDTGTVRPPVVNHTGTSKSSCGRATVIPLC